MAKAPKEKSKKKPPKHDPIFTRVKKIFSSLFERRMRAVVTDPINPGLLIFTNDIQLDRFIITKDPTKAYHVVRLKDEQLFADIVELFPMVEDVPCMISLKNVLSLFTTIEQKQKNLLKMYCVEHYPEKKATSDWDSVPREIQNKIMGTIRAVVRVNPTVARKLVLASKKSFDQDTRKDRAKWKAITEDPIDRWVGYEECSDLGVVDIDICIGRALSSSFFMNDVLRQEAFFEKQVDKVVGTTDLRTIEPDHLSHIMMVPHKENVGLTLQFPVVGGISCVSLKEYVKKSKEAVVEAHVMAEGSRRFLLCKMDDPLLSCTSFRPAFYALSIFNM